MDVSTLRKQTQTPANKVRKFISNMTFIELGTVSGIYNKGKRIDVTLPYLDAEGNPQVLKGIEVLRLGTNAVSLIIEPKVGDCVLLVCPKSYVMKQLFNSTSTQSNYDKYGIVNLKAILIQPIENKEPSISLYIDSEDKLSISTKKDITLDSEAKITITTDSDLSIEANKATITADEVSINDHFKVTS